MGERESRNRRFERVDLRARVQVTSLEPARDPESGVPTLWDTHELCETLSVGGAFIRTADPPAKGQRLLLQIYLPGGESVETLGRVAWTRVPLRGARGAGVGVEFVAPSGAATGALERFLTHARSDPPES
ncbi:MAG TPA: PilZ domain-containing protein [Myxococcota bacterium]|nr:PilZ domain-containing protein [Myxococcota bacterium]